MTVAEALVNIEVDQVKLLKSKIAHTKQAMRELPELANQFQPILDDYVNQLAQLEETV